MDQGGALNNGFNSFHDGSYIQGRKYKAVNFSLRWYMRVRSNYLYCTEQHPPNSNEYSAFCKYCCKILRGIEESETLD